MSRPLIIILLLVGLFSNIPSVYGQMLPELSYSPTDEEPFLAPPRDLEISAINVTGVDDAAARSFIIQSSGLEVGKTVSVPLDPSFQEAIRSVFRLGNYSDVKVFEESRGEDGISIRIHVTEVPRLREVRFEGVKRSHRKDLEEKAPLIARTPVRQSDVERTKQVIKSFYEEKGKPLATVEVVRTENEDNTVDLEFQVERGPTVEIKEFEISGVENVNLKKLHRKLENKEDKWWRFWKKSRLDRNKYDEDLGKVISFLNERGYYDAHIVQDTIYLDRSEEDPGMVVRLNVQEGPLYHIRDIKWEGNTVYPDVFLSQSLGFEKGDTYNSTKLESNLYSNKRSSDVSSLYMNRGYMTFRVQPTVEIVDGDSLDLVFDIAEGDIFTFGNIEINGNDKTKDHVIRRELYTIPGQTFSRDAIQESIRRLMQLNYFSQESLGGGPGIDVNEQEKIVDLSYTLEETGSDQLQLSGTWGQFGLILSLGFEFNNFSAQNFFEKGAWKPLPSGDGQRLSLGVQTNGSFYQNYSLSYTEPWFRGKPTPVGFSLSYSRFGRNPFLAVTDGSLGSGSARVFYEKRLKWPDDKFSYLSGIRYQYTDNDGLYSSIPDGISQEVTLQQVLTRVSTDNPMFPSSGSNFRFSVELAAPLGNFTQYHKWRLKNTWHIPLAPKLTFSIGADYGYVGSLTGEDVAFQRFVVGGSPFDTQGTFNRFFFATDIIYMRSYPSGALGPRINGEPVGGRILNKYTSELRFMAIQTDQLQAAPYLFMDGANTWNDFKNYNPAEIYRSAGVGVRFFLPILGMLELAYGYNFDEFEPTARTNNHDGNRQWLFQFTIGQGFND